MIWHEQVYHHPAMKRRGLCQQDLLELPYYEMIFEELDSVFDAGREGDCHKSLIFLRWQSVPLFTNSFHDARQIRFWHRNLKIAPTEIFPLDRISGSRRLQPAHSEADVISAF